MKTKNRVTLVLALAVMALINPVASYAADRPLFQLPFICGQQWRGSTYLDHEPNTNSIDFFIVGGTDNGQPILASAAGRVTFAGWNNGGGWMVNIAHSGGWGTSYLHMLERPWVSDNQQVAQGQQIGRVGSTGQSSAPHLHYQQWTGSPSNTVRAAFNGVLVNIAVGTDQVLTSYNCGSTGTLHDLNGDDRVDILAIDPTGNQWVYPGTGGSGTSTFGARYWTGNGWQFMRSISVGDVTGDGKADILAVDSAGDQWVYPGNGRTFNSPYKAGQGWQWMISINLADVTGDGVLDILAVANTGKQYVYPGSRTGYFLAPYWTGDGWNTMTSINVADITGDGVVDILAVNTAGEQYVYPGTGTGYFKAPYGIGNGWQTMRAITLGDVNGDGKVDILAINSAGNQYVYPGVGGYFGAPYLTGVGWTGFQID